ncbi:uncharacterized protein Bfra_009775 [Botrytis fragariae]|uniref:Uncharacterized protein n=1 Tax=Botrytis fragariae TaxID=1964551 RepID=A0A8H6EFF1_9HELO|nr:uncharacterized protein Bfra_009775 [Botrytis fragariae]KAF5870389.1 hypothetical protein Bfra_009775 [Botrytis fragariae]
MYIISGIVFNLKRKKQAQMKLIAGINDDIPWKIKASIDIGRRCHEHDKQETGQNVTVTTHQSQGVKCARLKIPILPLPGTRAAIYPVSVRTGFHCGVDFWPLETQGWPIHSSGIDAGFTVITV